MDKYEIKTIYKKDYPETLKHASGIPGKLYYRGSFPAPKGYRYLCVVGSRRWTPYGQSALKAIMNGLKGYPISIVSGLAVGIDSMAHIAAMEAGLHCVAFPGSNLDWDDIYPREHVRLARDIAESGGALVSRWAQGYHTEKWAFPARNILMAGLGHATLVVEAALRSGALMTAGHALNNGRDILAVPGSIFSASTYGTHMLISKGAMLAASADDVLRTLGFDPKRKTERRRDMIKSLDGLSGMIMDIISREEATPSQLVQMTKADISDINSRLTLLELDGLIDVRDGIVSSV